tara:strand:+ start:3677 stop:4246 length:570 start_codon:yes stop_codon:yes gene_type:complete
MADMNQVLLIGRLANDPEEKHVGQQNTKLVNFTVATSEKIPSGKEVTEWCRCVAWSFIGDQLSGLRKGDLVTVMGRLQTRSWETSEGTKQYKTEVNASSVARIPRSTPAGKASPAAPSTPSWPFKDAKNGVNWPSPDETGSSYASDSGSQLAAKWADPANPRKGGVLYRLVDNEWEAFGDVPVDADIGF